MNLKNIVKQYNLDSFDNIITFIQENPESLTLSELSKVAEMMNNDRVDTAAYYTDDKVLDYVYKYLPEIKKNTIRVLEPSAGSGNFIQKIIDKYSYAEKLIIDVNDLDEESIEINKVLNKYRNIPSNVQINYHNVDFLSPLFYGEYDLIIGNPPFLKLNKKNGLKQYSESFNDNITRNMAGFFMQKSVESAEHVVLIMPKYFLNNPDFEQTRTMVNRYNIEYILDFGEKGFKGVLIETIGLIINTKEKSDYTKAISITKKIENKIKQSIMTDNKYPTWLLYRNKWFDEIAKNMKFDVFEVFRDRQITNAVLQHTGEVRVLKSRNIKRDGSGIINIENYDAYIGHNIINNFTVGKYYERDDVYLSPNMTYYPRVIRKPKNCLVNGSIAILSKKKDDEITNKHLEFLSSKTFEEFYGIARNYSTRSLNIDRNSVFYFGLYK